LNAELSLKSEVEFPDDLIKQAENDTALAQLLLEERSFLNIHVEALRSQLDNLQNTRSLYEREIEAVTRQIRANQVQFDSVQGELRDIKALVARGLSPVNRQMNLERLQAQIEMAEQGFQMVILRARLGITDVDQKVFDLKITRSAKLTEELQRTRVDLADIANRFRTDRDLLVEAQITTPTMVSGSSDLIETRSLTVVRVQEGKTVTLQADENTQLLPGDVLKVQRGMLPTMAGLEQLVPHSLIRQTGNKR
jgi:exopolysaccharide production protein ExoF